MCVRREGGREREDARVNALDAPTRREREREREGKGGKNAIVKVRRSHRSAGCARAPKR